MSDESSCGLDRDALRYQLGQARELSRVLEPEADERQSWQQSVDHAVSSFISELGGARTFSSRTRDLLEDFDRQVESSQSLTDLIKAVTNGVSKSGLLTAGPGHLGFVPGGGLYLGALADHLSSALNPFSADEFAAPIATHMHNQALRWLCDLVGYGDEAFGDLTSGGSIATLTALHVARKAAKIRSQDIASLCIYVGEHTHHCFQKAVDTLFGEDIHVRIVPSHSYAMDVVYLSEQISRDLREGLRPWLVVATAGSTNLGRIDPLADIARVAEQYGLWLHVDAAYGGFFRLVPELAQKFRGLEKADSIVLDPHKGLFLPYGSGAVLFKKGFLLCHQTKASYLQDRDHDQPEGDTGVGRALVRRSPMDYSLELTRPFRALRLWLTQKVYGREVLAAALREKRILAVYAAEELASMPHITLVTDPDLSILAFRFSPGGRVTNEGTAKLLSRINSHPEVFLSSTTIDGQMVIRVAILSFRTHMETIDKLLQIVRAESAQIAEGMGLYDQ